MMGKNYHKKTNRSRRKVQKLAGHAISVELADGKACFQMVLPMSEMLFDCRSTANARGCLTAYPGAGLHARLCRRS